MRKPERWLNCSQFAALAMDGGYPVLLQPITLRLVGCIVGVSRILLKGVVTRELPRRPSN